MISICWQTTNPQHDLSFQQKFKSRNKSYLFKMLNCNNKLSTYRMMMMMIISQCMLYMYKQTYILK